MFKKASLPIALTLATLFCGIASTYALTSSGSSDSGATTVSSGTSSEDSLSWAVKATSQIHVEATPKSGTFRDVMLITLKADNPRAQIWYVTSATASPGDALRYRKPIRITESQPLYFFAYVDEQTESKIEKEEYIIVSSSGSSGSISTSSGTIPKTPSDIAAILKKPVQKPVVVKPAPKPIAVAGSGKILSGAIDTASGKILSGTTTSAPPQKTATGETSATPKETIDSLYKEQTPLEGSEIKKLLQNSKSSGFESMDATTKGVVASGLVAILVAIGTVRFVRSRKK